MSIISESIIKSFPSTIFAIIASLVAVAGIYIADKNTSDKEMEIMFERVVDRNQILEKRVLVLEERLRHLEKTSEKNELYIKDINSRLMLFREGLIKEAVRLENEVKK